MNLFPERQKISMVYLDMANLIILTTSFNILSLCRSVWELLKQYIIVQIWMRKVIYIGHIMSKEEKQRISLETIETIND